MAYNSPLFVGFAARIAIIVPRDSGRPFEIAFHSPSSSPTDLLYTNEFAPSMECARQADSDADTTIVWGSAGSTASP